MSFGGNKEKNDSTHIGEIQKVMRLLAAKVESDIHEKWDDGSFGDMKFMFRLSGLISGCRLGVEINTKLCAKGELMLFAEVDEEKSYLFEGTPEEVTAYLNNRKNASVILNSLKKT